LNLRGNWNYPTNIRFGAGRITELPGICRELGMRHPLLVTDEGLGQHMLTKHVLGLCEEEGLSVGLFSAVSPNPTGVQVEAGVEVFRAGGHDGVIAFGGGSGLDAGKAIAFMAAQDAPIWEFEDIGDNYLRAKVEGLPPVVAIPTTSGTGSEVGRASVITDEAVHKKKIIFHPMMLPNVALGDPELTVGLSAPLTAATGMDALSHSMEAYFAPFYHPMAQGIAVEGMRLVKEWLALAVADGTNIAARSHMMAASQMGAAAFQRGLGGMHALAHSLGALYGSHHGLLNAVLMPYVLAANAPAIEEDAAYLSRCLGFEASLNGLIAWVMTLRKEIGIPHSLRDIGINADDAELVGRMAVEDPSAGGNPMPFTAEQYAKIFEIAVEGTMLVKI
jgi:alcohol dehydrogenase class IV